MKTTKKYITAFVTTSTLLASTICAPALAGTASTNLTVSATVAANCSITTTPVAFGSYDPVTANATADLLSTGTVAVACTKNTPTTNLYIALGQGTHFSSNRRMQAAVNTTDFLNYELYQPPNNAPGTACPSSAGSVIWGNGPGTGAYGTRLALTSPTSKAARIYNVCGIVTAGQDVSVDSYNDTVQATINF